MTNSKPQTYQQIQLLPHEDLTGFCLPSYLPHLNPETVTRQKADTHWLLVNASGDVVARCSLWWSDTPPYPGHRVGLIGHYAARDAEAARQLLQLACCQLAKHGCTLAVGPMDGNTWQSYRLVTGRGSEPPFFLEPDNPAEWPAHFTGNGFSVLAAYVSALNADLAQSDTHLAKAAARAATHGFTIRPFNADEVERELAHLYQLALASFSRNFLYTPLQQADFMAMYRPLLPHIQPELITIAEKEGRPVGFIFALPDLLQTKRGQVIDTVIIKTVAVHPDYQIYGLGSLLVHHCQEVASNLDYKRAIHALMHESNASHKISRRYQTNIIRRYALFAKSLECVSNESKLHRSDE